MGTTVCDQMLDALDNAPQGIMTGASSYVGQLATVQWIAGRLGISDSYARRTAIKLLDQGLVKMWDGLDPVTRRRRIYITGGPK